MILWSGWWLVKVTTGVKPEENPEVKYKLLLVSILSFLWLAVPGYLAQGKAACFSPGVPEVPEEKPSDLPKASARAGCEDLDFTSLKLFCNPWARLQQNLGSSLALLVSLKPIW